eukprot:346938-Alexandrium_andersonii.AAC.1
MLSGLRLRRGLSPVESNPQRSVSKVSQAAQRSRPLRNNAVIGRNTGRLPMAKTLWREVSPPPHSLQTRGRLPMCVYNPRECPDRACIANASAATAKWPETQRRNFGSSDSE